MQAYWSFPVNFANQFWKNLFQRTSLDDSENIKLPLENGKILILSKIIIIVFFLSSFTKFHSDTGRWFATRYDYCFNQETKWVGLWKLISKTWYFFILISLWDVRIDIDRVTKFKPKWVTWAHALLFWLVKNDKNVIFL